MSALGLLAGRIDLGSDELCPHPERLRTAALRVQGGRQAMVVCPECAQSMRNLIVGWHAHLVGPAEVTRALRNLGYSRLDAARFLLQLVSDRLKLRVGLLKEADL